MTLPVLITGGAGYIGSHAVLAFRDAGWPVVVIDNLVTGFRSAVPDDVSFVEGNIDDGRLVGDDRKAWHPRDCPFRRVGGGARIGRRSAQILSQ